MSLSVSVNLCVCLSVCVCVSECLRASLYVDRHDHLKPLNPANNLVDMDSSRNIFPVVYPMFHQRAHRITSIHDLVFLLFQMIKNRSNLVDGHSAERSPSRLDKFL